MALTTNRSPPAAAQPCKARLLASVAPLVKTTWAGWTFTSAATCSRACSSAARARRARR